MQTALLILDDVDMLVAGEGGRASPAVLATLRALLRTPASSPSRFAAKGTEGAAAASVSAGRSEGGGPGARTMLVLATTSCPTHACGGELADLFDDTLLVPLVEQPADAAAVLGVVPGIVGGVVGQAADEVLRRGPLGVKTLIRLGERSVATAALGKAVGGGGGAGVGAGDGDGDGGARQLASLTEYLEDRGAAEQQREESCVV
mmetsp:Transcript_5705/g.11607  ORF Transcript_5705/g.11607 Transcript_5705/m.11607 type:complete len:204 (-) Transcript_5705:134-745(-)